MRSIFGKLLLSIALTQSVMVFAHEGHGSTPGSTTAPNGGTIKGTPRHFVEVVYEAGKLRIYVFDHDMKKSSLEGLEIAGSIKFPKSKKPTGLKLSRSTDKFETVVDANGAYRFTLDLTLTKDGKSDKISFNIEP